MHREQHASKCCEPTTLLPGHVVWGACPAALYGLCSWALSIVGLQVITELIDAAADVTVKDRIGRSVLHLAAEHGHADAISVLVTAMMAVKVDLHAQARTPDIVQLSSNPARLHLTL